MLVSQAKSIAREWVAQEAAQAPGFCGAFFHGSVNWLADEDTLPPVSDVDVMVVMEGSVPLDKLGKLFYRGVLIEVSYLPEEQLRTAEQVLGLPHLAGSLRVGSLIADPTGRLSALEAAVSKDYAKRRWVIRRCSTAREKVLANLSGLDEAAPLHHQVNHWLFGAGVTTYILLAAGLENPTVRKRYLAVRELLARCGRLDFYESLLEMLGCEMMSQALAREHLDALAVAFDAASAAIHTPVPFAADISELARPVAIDGSRELIERGDQREAVFWMLVTYTRCQEVLYHDSPEDVQARLTPGYLAFLADLGIHSFDDLARRCREVEEALPRVWEEAEAIMAANPQIEDEDRA
jgi:hypothetical protein